MCSTILSVLLLLQADSSNSHIHFQIAESAMEQVGITLYYSSEYRKLGYPNGDFPMDRGVCTDVVIRAFRKIGVDLQKEVHEDMVQHFEEYPKIWKLKSPDSNIDHRRVPNLMKYFSRKGKSISLDDSYLPGDIVAWLLRSGNFHIGIVSTEIIPGKKHYFITHNIGDGAKKEDVLYAYKIIGHYRW